MKLISYRNNYNEKIKQTTKKPYLSTGENIMESTKKHIHKSAYMMLSSCSETAEYTGIK